MSAAKDQKQVVFVLSLITVESGGDYPYRPEHTIVGVFANKGAAAEAAGGIDTQNYGTFDDAICSNQFRGDAIDNRKNPPDSGTLLKLGSKDTGEGDSVELKIQKFPLFDAQSSNTDGASVSRKKRKS